MKECKCNCGYRCGGPGKCKLGVMECLEQKGQDHFVRDCGHDFSGPFVHFPSGGSVTCKACDTTAMHHDMAVGP